MAHDSDTAHGAWRPVLGARGTRGALDTGACSELRGGRTVRLHGVGCVDLGGARAGVPELEDPREAHGRHVAGVGAGGAHLGSLAVSNE